MRIWIRRAIVVVVFLAALIGFSIYFNKSTTDITIEMQAATLPVVYVDLGGNYINEMHGYVDPMDVSTLRDSVTPVGDDRQISFVVEKYGTGVSSLSIEVRSQDGERLIEDTQIVNYRDLQNELQATVALKDLIEADQEYNVALVLNLTDGRTVYYYTRVIQDEDADGAAKVDFVLDFNNKTFSKSESKELSTYLESSSAGINSDFGNVGIHSSLSQVAWGDLEPIVESSRVATIYDIGDKMASIKLNYQVCTKIDGVKKHYNVTEFYRVREGSDRFHLITFDRNMSEIFVMNNDSISGNTIDLGIQQQEASISQSEGGEVVAFVNGGRLYSYNTADNKLARLYAFYDDAEDDVRHQYAGSDIKILNVEENGNVSFLVYGYMNRGTHEGMVGVELCYYDSLVNTVEEQLFVPYSKSREILKCDVASLSYFNLKGNLFLYLDGTIYQISTETLEYTEIASNLNADTFFVSDSEAEIAWQEREDDSHLFGKLSLMNLETEEVTEIKGGSGEYVMPIGFMKEDIIYGLCNSDDVVMGIFGDTIAPMKKVIIQSEEGQILKEYEKEGIYILSGTINGNQLDLVRAVKDDNGDYQSIDADQITSNDKTETLKNNVETVTSDSYKLTYEITLRNEVDTKTMKLLTPGEVVFEGGRQVDIETGEDDRFVVYGNGYALGMYDDEAAAVALAYESRGTVTDTKGNVIYKRAETADRNQIMSITEESVTDTKNSMAVCLDNMLKLQGISRNTEYNLNNGESVENILKDNLKDAYVLNLTGCTMDVALYYVNQDIPVLAMLDSDHAVLIIGFNAQNVVLFDPESGTIYKSGMNDTRELFQENGNCFMTYAVINAD